MPSAPSQRRLYKRSTIHSALKRLGCRQSEKHSHPEKTYWLTPSGEPFDLSEPEYVSTHYDPNEKQYLFTADYLSLFLLNLLRLLGGDTTDLNFILEELGLSAKARVRLVKETKH
jgi:hypothetical protein